MESHSKPIERKPRGPKARGVHIAPPMRKRLTRSSLSSTASVRDSLRAEIILLASQGTSNAEFGARLGCSIRTVHNWRKRFAAHGTAEASPDTRRSGRAGTVPAPVRCELIKLACERPEGSQALFRDVWTIESTGLPLLGKTGWKESKSEIGRILRAREIRPHRRRLWPHSPDPDFWTRARTICQIYRHPPEGASVICGDEKTSIQALERIHPTHWAGKRVIGKFEFEYERQGTQALIAPF